MRPEPTIARCVQPGRGHSPTCINIATAKAMLMVGAIPILVDFDPDTYNMGCHVPNLAGLPQPIAALEAQRTTAKTTIDWRFNTGDARLRLERLYPKLDETNNDVSKTKMD